MDATETDAAFEALSSNQRRRVLTQLHENGTVTINTESEDDERIISLMHAHLPRLAAEGFIEYHVHQGEIAIERGPRFTELDALLEAVESIEDEHSR